MSQVRVEASPAHESRSPVPSSLLTGTAQAVLAPPPVSDHELLRPIGAGSYGEVWLARNAMGTWRAVKVVRRQTFDQDEHFEREFNGLRRFEPVSRLHPGLVDILQIGRDLDGRSFYYVMELADPVNGPEHLEPPPQGSGTGHEAVPPSGTQDSLPSYLPHTLAHDLRKRAALPVEHCLRIGLELAAALEHLHASSLVHRDIKPSNIIFVGGVPKLADIGLVARIGEAHSLVGTVGYIPPEGPGAPPADIFSLGKVLYEAAFGKDRRDFPQLPAGLRNEPHHQALLELNEIIVKACAADLRQRYNSARAMRLDLERLVEGRSLKSRHRFIQACRVGMGLLLGMVILGLSSAGAFWLARTIPARSKPAAATQAHSDVPAVPPKEEVKTVAILPFDNLRPDSTRIDVGAHLAEELSLVLGGIPNLHVLGAASAAALHASTNALAAAREHGVDLLVTGSVWLKDSRLRLSPRVVASADGSIRWSPPPYDGDSGKPQGLEFRFVEDLVRAVGVPLTDTVRQRIAVRMTVKPEAYLLYLEGRYFCSQRTKSSLEEAKRRYQSVIALDDSYALAYAGLAECYALASDAPPAESMKQTRRWAEEALRRDPTLAEALVTLAYSKLNLEWDWAGAEGAFQRALETNPNDATARHWYGLYYLAFRRFQDALNTRLEAEQLDPLSPTIKLEVGDVYYFQRRFEQALDYYNAALRLDPDSPRVCRALARVYAQTKSYDDAIALGNRAVARAPGDALLLATLGHTYGMAGRRSEAFEALRQLESLGRTQYVSPYQLAKVWAGLGDDLKSLELLEAACAGRHRGLVTLPVDLEFEQLREHPRFQKLLERMGLKTDAPDLRTSSLKSIAVLPFDTSDLQREGDFLGSQIAEAEAGILSKIPGVRVLGRESAAALRNADNRQAKARQMQLDLLVEGSVRRSANQLQLTVQAVTPKDGFVIWSDSYDRDMSEIFGLETAIAERIADALQIRLTESVRAALAAKPTRNLQAYELYLEGRHFLHLDKPESAIERFESAIGLAPGFAAAHAGIADGYLRLVYTTANSTVMLPKAAAAAESAFRADASSVEALASLAESKFLLYDWEGAEKALGTGARLNPSYARLHRTYAKYLTCQGRFTEAITESKLARDLDPESNLLRVSLGWTLFDARKYDEAQREFEQILHASPGFGDARDGVGWCLYAKGRDAEGVAFWGQGREFIGLDKQEAAVATRAFHADGVQGFWRSNRDAYRNRALLGHPEPYDLALALSMLGEKEEAMDNLEQAAREHTALMPFIGVEYTLVGLHSHPRFLALLEKMGLQLPLWPQE